MGRHIIGSETEFGIVAVDAPEVSPILTSTQAVIAYADTSGQGVNRRTRWDYENESPLRDLRGFDLRRYRAGAAPVLDPNALGAANVITSSGARFYVDHAHPEYSSPETTSAYAAVVWDQAGDRIMHQAAQASGAVADQPELKIYKNNVDGKGASYGSHENYLFPRQVDVALVQQALIPHFVTRQIFSGAGRVGLGVEGQEHGFQISQRADYIETDVSLETTLNRGIINTRDEPHADSDRWRRLHVIIGDANLSEFSNYLKFGTTALVLAAVQHGADFSDLALLDPVGSVKQVSRDLTCTAELKFYGNKALTAIAVQKEIRARVERTLEAADWFAGQDGTDDDRQVLRLWGQILDDLAADPKSTADRLDWTAKLSLLDAYRARGLDWSDPRMALIDIQYSDIDPQRGLYHALVRKGRMRTLVNPEDVERATAHPPRDTRAWLRGHLVTTYSDSVLAANWDSIVLDTPWEGSPAARIALAEPTGFTSADIGEFAPGKPVADIVAQIAAAQPGAVTGVG